MILADALRSEPDRTWDYAIQTGIKHAVIGAPNDGKFDITDYSHWKSLYDRYMSKGLTPVVVEGAPEPAHESIKRGDANRDKSIEQVLKYLPILDKLNLRTICINWMPYKGWFRTRNNIPARGGALVTGFYREDIPDTEPLLITTEQLWENLTYFLKAVVPSCEKYGVKLAFHPDDPPVPRLGDVERILINRANIEKALNIVPSAFVGITLCQGCFCAMGEDIYDTITAFNKREKVFFVHFRDIEGTPQSFCETFHDIGPTDMVRCLELYREYGFNGPVRVDHVPTMAGDDNTRPGYAAVGRLFAIGYLKGMLDALHYPYI
ncbi:mannonate dehydratase [Spirochaetia bacterium]|nr:mannonate dehydratase [Spirochaetia bacterium]